jgi:hypothetical protein
MAIEHADFDGIERLALVTGGWLAGGSAAGPSFYTSYYDAEGEGGSGSSSYVQWASELSEGGPSGDT